MTTMIRKVTPKAWILLLVSAVAAAVSSDGSALADYDAGLKAFEQGNFELAYKEWLPLAEQGEGTAQHGVALLYETGRGVPKRDETMAIRWYEEAATQGILAATNNLALMYAEGRGSPRDFAKAAELWKTAADKGHAMSQHNLALLYLNGLGVERNATMAANWLLKAAEANVVDAQYNIAELYRLGLGIEQNLEEAQRWYQASAKGGNSDAVRRLAALELEQKVSPSEQPVATPAEELGTTPAVTAPAEPIAPPKKPGLSAGGENSPPATDETSAAPDEAAAEAQITENADAAVGTPTSDEPTASETAGTPPPETSVTAAPDAGSDDGASPFRVQVASVKSAEGAEQTWASLRQDYPDLLAELNHSVRRVDLGADMGIWYRLYAGPVASRDAAQALCANFMAKSAMNSCLVVAD